MYYIVLRYQRGNQKRKIKGHVKQWLKEKEQKTNNAIQNITQKTKDRAT